MDLQDLASLAIFPPRLRSSHQLVKQPELIPSQDLDFIVQRDGIKPKSLQASFDSGPGSSRYSSALRRALRRSAASS